MMTWKFSRSHDQCYIDCPRKAYNTYYYNGTGIVKKGLDLHQETGSLTHEMLKRVLMWVKEHNALPTLEVLNAICAHARADYEQAINAAGFNEYSGQVELEIQRQGALAEGLCRAWVLIRLPRIMEDYEIVAVEEEHDVPFGPGQILMSRLDGVLKRKSDGALFAGPEFKTTGWISEDYIESWRYSTQTLSHCLDVESTYGQMPQGVLMEFLYKGMKKKAEDGSYVYYSPLVRAYKMVDSFSEESYGFDSALGRKKDWKAFDTYTMGMERWMNEIPREVLEEILYTSIVYRSAGELEEWKRQVQYRQARIEAGVKVLQSEPTKEAADEVMASIFPARLDQFCYSDQYKKKCPFLEICYGSVADPLESGLYVPRVPHHPGEFLEEE